MKESTEDIDVINVLNSLYKELEKEYSEYGYNPVLVDIDLLLEDIDGLLYDWAYFYNKERRSRIRVK